MTIHFFSKLFGYDPEVVKKQPTASRQKIVTMGSMMLIPVLLWMFSGFYISRHLMEVSLVSSLGVSLILGMIICIVDRSFIATPKMKGGYLLLVYRLGFAVITTILGTLAIDLMVFEGDLEEYRAKQQEIDFQQAKDTYITDQFDARMALEASHLKAEKDEADLQESFVEEMEGSGGTGTYGKGAVAAAKEKLAKEAGMETERLREELAGFDEKVKKEAEAHAGEVTKKSKAAILSKIEDLHAYLGERPVGEFVYWVFFFFVFFLEGAFVLYKFSASSSLFEDMLLAEEEIGKDRLAQMRKRRGDIIKEDEQMGYGAGRVRSIAADQRTRRIL